MFAHKLNIFLAMFGSLPLWTRHIVVLTCCGKTMNFTKAKGKKKIKIKRPRVNNHTSWTPNITDPSGFHGSSYLDFFHSTKYKNIPYEQLLILKCFEKCHDRPRLCSPSRTIFECLTTSKDLFCKAMPRLSMRWDNLLVCHWNVNKFSGLTIFFGTNVGYKR